MSASLILTILNIFQFINDDAHREEINTKIKSQEKEEPKTTEKGKD
jgi:hypothetical protein